MPSEIKQPAPAALSDTTVFIKKRAPTLYFIIGFKLFWGVLFLLVAICAYAYSDNDLPAEFQRFLDFWRVHPDNKFWSAVAARVGQLTETKMLIAAAGTLAYGLLLAVEGVGLIFRLSWAGWLAIGQSAFFIPLEVYDLVERFSWSVAVVLVINVIIVWYLIENRQRLFRPHHHH